MKKNVLTSVTVSLAAAAMISGTAMAAEYKVGIIQFVDDASLNQIEQNIEKELTAKSEEGGDTYVFDGYVYNGQADSTTLNQITTQLIDDGVDVIVPIATPAAQIVQAATEDNPVSYTHLQKERYERLLYEGEAELLRIDEKYSMERQLFLSFLQLSLD